MNGKPQQEILAWLMQGGSLTVQEAFRRFRTTELRTVVHRLRMKGYNVVDGWEYGMRYGSPVRFKRYSLDAGPGCRPPAL